MNKRPTTKEELITLIKHGDGELLDILADQFWDLRTEVAELTDALQLEVNRSKIMYSLLDGLSAIETTRPDNKSYPSEKIITAKDPLGSMDGFYWAESTENGEYYRWTGPGLGFHFATLLDRSDELDFRLDLHAYHEGRGLEGIQYKIDDNPWSALRLVDGLLAGTGTIPSSVTPDTLLNFVVPRVETASADDNRKIGVAFKELIIAKSGSLK